MGACCLLFVLRVLSVAMCSSFWMLVPLFFFGIGCCLAIATALGSCALLQDLRFCSVWWLIAWLLCWCLVSVLPNFSAEMCAGSLASGRLFSRHLYVWNRQCSSILVPKIVIWEAWCLHLGTPGILGGYSGILGAPWATLGAAGMTCGDPGFHF